MSYLYRRGKENIYIFQENVLWGIDYCRNTRAKGHGRPTLTNKQGYEENNNG